MFHFNTRSQAKCLPDSDVTVVLFGKRWQLGGNNHELAHEWTLDVHSVTSVSLLPRIFVPLRSNLLDGTVAYRICVRGWRRMSETCCST